MRRHLRRSRASRDQWPGDSPLGRARAARLPFVLLNMSMTADGKIATSNRAVTSFGSRRDQRHLLELRATADAVMAGARTVDSSKVTMGPGSARYCRKRVMRGLTEYNLRVIVSRSGSVNPKAEVFKRRFSPIILLTTRRAEPARLRRLGVLVDEVRICGGDRINFRTALRWLRKKWRVKRLLCEGGGELNDALFRADLVDELHLTVCPTVFGGRDSPTLAGGMGAGRLAWATPLECLSAQRIAGEMFFVFRRAGARGQAFRHAAPAARASRRAGSGRR